MCEVGSETEARGRIGTSSAELSEEGLKTKKAL
jgi:hypothetical protein